MQLRDNNSKWNQIYTNSGGKKERKGTRNVIKTQRKHIWPENTRTYESICRILSVTSTTFHWSQSLCLLNFRSSLSRPFRPHYQSYTDCTTLTCPSKHLPYPSNILFLRLYLKPYSALKPQPAARMENSC